MRFIKPNTRTPSIDYLVHTWQKSINPGLMIRFTGAQYGTDPELQPRPDEVRDMFSRGQIVSKLWVLDRVVPLYDQPTILIVGSWFGLLGAMIKEVMPHAFVTMLDIDPRCKTFADAMNYQVDNLDAVTGDMYDFDYSGYDIVINTSSEHIADIPVWVSMLEKGTTVILQNNDAHNIAGHINCVNSRDELSEKSNLTEIEYLGNLDLGIYRRFMVIGAV